MLQFPVFFLRYVLLGKSIIVLLFTCWVAIIYYLFAEFYYLFAEYHVANSYLSTLHVEWEQKADRKRNCTCAKVSEHQFSL